MICYVTQGVNRNVMFRYIVGRGVKMTNFGVM